MAVPVPSSAAGPPPRVPNPPSAAGSVSQVELSRGNNVLYWRTTAFSVWSKVPKPVLVRNIGITGAWEQERGAGRSHNPPIPRSLSPLPLPGVAFTSECFPCKPGTFAPAAGSASCQPCPADTFSGKGATACQPCDPDTYAGERGHPGVPRPRAVPLVCDPGQRRGRVGTRGQCWGPRQSWHLCPGWGRAQGWPWGGGEAVGSWEHPLAGGEDKDTARWGQRWGPRAVPAHPPCPPLRQSPARAPANLARPARTRISSTRTRPATPAGR